jgi:hypothetical protein
VVCSQQTAGALQNSGLLPWYDSLGHMEREPGLATPVLSEYAATARPAQTRDARRASQHLRCMSSRRPHSSAVCRARAGCFWASCAVVVVHTGSGGRCSALLTQSYNKLAIQRRAAGADMCSSLALRHRNPSRSRCHPCALSRRHVLG